MPSRIINLLRNTGCFDLANLKSRHFKFGGGEEQKRSTLIGKSNQILPMSGPQKGLLPSAHNRYVFQEKSQ